MTYWQNSSENTPLAIQAATELLFRREARRGLLAFTEYTMPTFVRNWHHAVLCDALDKFAVGDLTRLMVFLPPRHSKSEFVSRRLPAYIFGINPDAQIVGTSYSADLSSRMNRDVQRIIDSPPYHTLFPDTNLFGSNVRTVANNTYLRNSDIFEIVGYRGSYRSAGVGGGITGMGFTHGIIDDPYKDRQQANSRAYLRFIRDWYTDVFYTRQERNAGILVTATRWAEDDVPGWLLNLMENDPNADQWVVISLPAIAEEPLAPYDPRKPGEALWQWKYDESRLSLIKATLGTYSWNALYQQTPKPIEGNRIKRDWLKIKQVSTVQARRVRYWDKAGTDDDGDYTCGVLIARTDDGLYIIEDVIRGQWSAYKREQVILQTAHLDKKRFGHVTIWVEQEPGSGGKESAEATIRNLAGFSVYADRPTGDKDIRLEPFAAQAEAGNVLLIEGSWNRDYIEELVTVPNSAYRDQSDATAGAFNKLAVDRTLRMSDALHPLTDYRG